MLTDEIDPTRATEDTDAIRGSIQPPEFVDHWLLPLARQARSNKNSPNANIHAPE